MSMNLNQQRTQQQLWFSSQPATARQSGLSQTAALPTLAPNPQTAGARVPECGLAPHMNVGVAG